MNPRIKAIRDALLHGSENQQIEAVTLARGTANESLLFSLLDLEEGARKRFISAVPTAGSFSIPERGELRSVLAEVLEANKNILVCWYINITLVDLGDLSDSRFDDLLTVSSELVKRVVDRRSQSIGNWLLESNVRHETVRAVSRFKQNPLAGKILRQYYDGEVFPGRKDTVQALYGLGALGDDSYRSFVQFKATQSPEESERNAAQVALRLWGTSDYDMIEQQSKVGAEKAKCFVATAVFENSDAPPVVKLRHFRNEYLLPNRPGRLFVWLYGIFGPVLSDWIVARPGLKGAVRKGLEMLVAAYKQNRT